MYQKQKTVAELRAERTTTAHRLMDMLNKSAGRDLNPAEEAEGERLSAKLTELDDDIAVAEQRLLVKPGFGGKRRAPCTEARGRALDLVELVEKRSDLVSLGMAERVTRLIEEDRSRDDRAARWALAAADPNYATAFAKWIADPIGGHLTWTENERHAFAEAQNEARAMSLTNGQTGHYLVPFALDPAVVLTNTGTSVGSADLRTAFTVKTIATDVYHGVASDGVTAEWIAEATEVADASPTLAQPTIDVHKADAFVPFSVEVELDSDELLANLQVMFFDAKSRLEAAAFITGNGTTQPKGLITALVADGKLATSTASNVFTPGDDVYALKKSLPARYRKKAGWLANEDLYDEIRKSITDGATPTINGFWADLGQGVPPLLLGHPVFETSEMDATYGSGENYVMAYGDLKSYYVIDRIGATVELVPHLFGENGRPTLQRGVLVWWRTGGDLVNTDALRVLNVT
jgi:HK97 family phage major capsid protein